MKKNPLLIGAKKLQKLLFILIRLTVWEEFFGWTRVAKSDMALAETGLKHRITIKPTEIDSTVIKHFESSQKLRKDGIGIWENFIRNILSNYLLCTGTGILYMLGLS